MMIDTLHNEETRGALPTSPVASEVALEAGATEAQATAMIATAWAQAEAFCDRRCYPVTAAQRIIQVKGIGVYRWPWHPAPDAFTFERRTNGEWVVFDVEHIAGLIDIDTPVTETWRITQVGAVDPGTPPAHVIQAVANLALYQLVQMPQRREFKSQNAGDSGFTRESLMGLFWASGAGPMLASEVRK
ncbi:hypothetical protein [Falsiphaeobacter marinintestinus]|uniref:hypothetical protein n=1 Tax=Falsiphaeobacter marinintestinus TaxID=1492905 RepID=UPI0011B50261|nr:hypothetical protein [Phaeobacter marinintestinus]